MSERRLSRRVLALGVGVVGAIVLAEAVCRVDAFFPGLPFDSQRARMFFAARAASEAQVEHRAFGMPDPALSEADVLPYVHPYAGWSNAATDALATRMVRETSAGGETAFDVLLLGGSVAGNLSAAGAPRLVELLSADARVAGREVRVWNFARPSYRAPQPFAWCAWLLALGARPDFVLVIDGFNEVAMSVENLRLGSHPAYPAFSYWSVLARGGSPDPAFLDLVAEVRLARRVQIGIARQAHERGFHRSALLTRITQRRLRHAADVVQTATARLRAWRSPADEPALRGPAFEGDERAAVESALDLWSAATRALHGVCAVRGVPSLSVVQPTLADPGAKRATAEEERRATPPPGWIEGIRIGYPLLRERAARLAAEGLPIADATRAFADVDETLFVDVVHFDERGNVALVEWIAPRMLAQM